jgi:membrane protein YqaA with SNARE-associated domain
VTNEKTRVVLAALQLVSRGVHGCGDGGASLVTETVCTATGPLGLLIVAVYSVLIAVVLPLPSEVVLFAPLSIGLPDWLTVALIVLISAAGKAAGSLLAFRIGNGVTDSGFVVRRLRESRFDVVEWSENKTVKLAQEYGYIGMALALCVPFFPDTLSIYAFSVLEESYWRFGLASFVGGVGRLLVTLALLGAGMAAV